MYTALFKNVIINGYTIKRVPHILSSDGSGDLSYRGSVTIRLSRLIDYMKKNKLNEIEYQTDKI